MALVNRIQNPFAPRYEVLYMLIDATKVEETRLLLTGNMRRVQALGALKAAEGAGRKMLAPPLEARGFSKLEPLQLQYLYWNLCGKTPTDDYGALIQECLAAAKAMTPNDDAQHSLDFLVEQLEASAPGSVTDETGAVVKPVKTALESAPVRPKGTTTTGIIWSICDETLADLHKGEIPSDFKALRAEAWKRCDAEGFNSGTFGVQYGKWKANKLASKSGV